MRHLRKKPAVFTEVVQWFGISEDAEGAKKMALVGDRVLSDVVMANNTGMLSIRVQPFDTAKENFVVKLIRPFEDSLLPLLLPSKCRQSSPLFSGLPRDADQEQTFKSFLK